MINQGDDETNGNNGNEEQPTECDGLPKVRLSAMANANKAAAPSKTISGTFRGTFRLSRRTAAQRCPRLRAAIDDAKKIIGQPRPGGRPVRHVPLIAMTADAMHGDRRRRVAAGMDGYSAKPITPDALDALNTTLTRWLTASAAKAALTSAE